MDKQQILNKDYLIKLGAIQEKGKIYSIDFYKVAVFEDGFIFFLGTSMFSHKIQGKTIEDFDKIWHEINNPTNANYPT